LLVPPALACISQYVIMSIRFEKPEILIYRDSKIIEQFQIAERGRRYILGRESSCDFVLSDKEISRTHISFEWDLSNVVVLRDEGCTNGVRINGKQVTQEIELYPDDKISTAGFIIKVNIPANSEKKSVLEVDNPVDPDPSDRKPVSSSSEYLLLAGGLLLLLAALSAVFLGK